MAKGSSVKGGSPIPAVGIRQGGYFPHDSRERNAHFLFELRMLNATSPTHPTQFTMADLLNAQDIKTWLKKLPTWDHDKKHIERVFEFDDFSEAIEFVNGV